MCVLKAQFVDFYCSIFVAISMYISVYMYSKCNSCLPSLDFFVQHTNPVIMYTDSYTPYNSQRRGERGSIKSPPPPQNVPKPQWKCPLLYTI